MVENLFYKSTRSTLSDHRPVIGYYQIKIQKINH
jgi:hypothetical protein